MQSLFNKLAFVMKFTSLPEKEVVTFRL